MENLWAQILRSSLFQMSQAMETHHNESVSPQSLKAHGRSNSRTASALVEILAKFSMNQPPTIVFPNDRLEIFDNP